VLEGLTTAIIVDQERMGANSRSTVGTATDANAMLRVLFSRLGKPHVGSPNAFSFNVPSVHVVGQMQKGAGKAEKVTFTGAGGEEVGVDGRAPGGIRWQPSESCPSRWAGCASGF